MLRSRLTEMFGLRYPVVLAPMGGGYTSGRLAAAVSEAGGLGMFGGIHNRGPDWVRSQIQYVRSHTERPFGVGFITQLLPMMMANFEVCLEERVPVIAFSFADPTPYVAEAKAAGATVLRQVQTVEGARTALTAGADVLVAQGYEAGGHTGLLGTLPCLTLVLDVAGGTPVLAAGGIGDARSVAAVLAAGAEGVWMGTALLATREAEEISDVYKGCIVASTGEDTVYTSVYDIMSGLPWPEGIAERVLFNAFTQSWHGREEELKVHREELLPEMPEASAYNRDPHQHAILIGQSAGSVRAVRPVAEVLADLCDGAAALLRDRTSALTGTTAPR
jgi:nitronate monooxygenase